MTNLRPDFLIGSKGWHFNHWVGSFYPDDLPQDWWFSYYSNEFQAVLLPADYIMRYDLSDWQSWLDDAPQDFTFYVEVSDAVDWPRTQQYLNVLRGQLGGLVLSIDAPIINSKVNALVKGASAYAPVSLDGQKPWAVEYGVDRLLQQLQVNSCWRGGVGSRVQWCFNAAAIVMRDDSVHNSPAELRVLLESCIKFGSSQGTVSLFFEGASPRIEDMQTATIISQLL